jgi:hypothetical protein
LGRWDASTQGRFVVTYGTLFDDDKVTQYYEAIVGTLKAARKRGIIDIEGQVNSRMNSRMAEWPNK